MEHVVVTPTGHHLFGEDVVNSFINNQEGKVDKIEDTKQVCIYARVSTKKQKDSRNLDRQIFRLTEYPVKKGYKIEEVFKEVVSGINENRRELKKLLNYIREIKI